MQSKMIQILIFFYSIKLNAKIDQISSTWFKIFSTCDDIYTNSLALNNDSGVIVVGNHKGLFIGNWGSDGSHEWSFSITDIAQAYSVTKLNNNDYVAVGYTDDFGLGYRDIAIISFDMHGSILWAYTFGLKGNDYAYNVIASREGGFFVTGSVVDMLNDSQSHPFIAKFSVTGEVRWWKTLPSIVGYGVALRELETGTIIMLVQSSQYDSSSSLLRISPEGKLLWQRSFFGKSSLISEGIDTLSDNSTIIVASLDESSIDNAAIMRMDHEGNFIFQFKINIEGYESQGSAIIALHDDSFIVTGRTSLFQGFENILLLKFDSQGSLLWGKVLMNPSAWAYLDSYAVAIEMLADGHFFITGGYQVNSKKAIQTLVAKFDSQGNINQDYLSLYQLITITHNITLLSFYTNSTQSLDYLRSSLAYGENITSRLSSKKIYTDCPPKNFSIFLVILLLMVAIISLVFLGSLIFNFCRKKPLHKTYFELPNTPNPLSQRFSFTSEKAQNLDVFSHLSTQKKESSVPKNQQDSSLSLSSTTTPRL